MKSKNLLIFVVLFAAIVTALTATIGTSLISKVYADKKHCKTMETITVTIQKTIKNYLRRMNVITKIQLSIIVMAMTSTIS